MPQDRDNPLREQEIARWRERERKDLDVEHDRGPRPLEGLSGAQSTVQPPGIGRGVPLNSWCGQYLTV